MSKENKKAGGVSVGWNLVTDGDKTSLEWGYIRGHNVENTYRISSEDAEKIRSNKEPAQYNEALNTVLAGEKEKIRLAEEEETKKRQKLAEEEKKVAEAQKKGKK